MVETMDETISAELYICDYRIKNGNLVDESKEILQKQRNKWLRYRSLLALKCDFPSKERRESLIRELYVVGRSEDLELCRALLERQTKSDDIKELVRSIVVKIESERPANNLNHI